MERRKAEGRKAGRRNGSPVLLWPLPLQSERKAGNRPPHPATPCGLRLVRTQPRLPPPSFILFHQVQPA